jgi:hypothetical protein
MAITNISDVAAKHDVDPRIDGWCANVEAVMFITGSKVQLVTLWSKTQW